MSHAAHPRPGGLPIALAFLIALVLGVPALAASEHMFDLSIEELLEFELIPGSILRQSIEDSPVVIDVISREQIDNLDARNLYELISFLPGIEVMETFFGRAVLQFRGIMNINYTNKVLLMINETPFFEPVNGAYFLESVPVNSIHQIEIIRGRGGTLYGTNSYSGVINITTKKGQDDLPLLDVSGGYGSFQTVHASLASRVELGHKSGVYFAAEVIDGDGFELNVKADENGQAKTFDYPDNVVRLYGNYQNHAVTIDAGYMRQDKMIYGITPVVAYRGVHVHELLYANGKYTHVFNAGFKSHLWLRYNHFSQPRGDIGYFPYAGFAGHDTSDVSMQFGGQSINTELQCESHWSSQIMNISGFVFETQKSDEYKFIWKSDNTYHPMSAFIKTPESYTVSGYSQFQYQPAPFIQVDAGLRVVKSQDVKDVFLSPRLGVVYTPGGTYHFKALYGQAFRIPSFFEKYVATGNVLFGSVDLEPEKLESFDLVVEGSSAKVTGRLNGFLTLTEDGIMRVPTDQPAEHGSEAMIYVNAARSRVYGIEASLNLQHNARTSCGFNMGWKMGRDDQTDKDLLYFANLTANTWCTWQPLASLSITPSAQYVGDRKGESTESGKYTIDAYTLLNLSTRYQLGDLSITITGKNLLDTDYVYPEFIRHKIDEMPGGPRRSVWVSLGRTF